MILTLFGIEILIFLFVILVILSAIAQLIPYLIAFGLVALGIKLVYEFGSLSIMSARHSYLYLSQAANNISELVRINRQQRYDRRAIKRQEKKSLQLVG